MFDFKTGRNLIVGDVVEFGGKEGNNWEITDLRDAAPDGTPYGNLRGYSARYVGKRSRYTRQGEEAHGMVKAGNTYRMV